MVLDSALYKLLKKNICLEGLIFRQIINLDEPQYSNYNRTNITV